MRLFSSGIRIQLLHVQHMMFGLIKEEYCESMYVNGIAGWRAVRGFRL